MLDIIHFFFEEDLMADSKEEIENKTRVRSIVYRDFYQKAYKYGNTGSDKSYNYSTASDGYLGEEEEADDIIDDPIKQSTKPYSPPTEFNPNSSNPFGKVVEPPLG